MGVESRKGSVVRLQVGEKNPARWWEASLLADFTAFSPFLYCSKAGSSTHPSVYPLWTGQVPAMAVSTFPQFMDTSKGWLGLVLRIALSLVTSQCAQKHIDCNGANRNVFLLTKFRQSFSGPVSEQGHYKATLMGSVFSSHSWHQRFLT